MPDLLFFHGFDATPDSLQGAVALFTENGYRVKTPTMKSFVLDEGHYFSPEQWLEEARLALETFIGSVRGNFFLAGHSLGGAICAHLLTGELEPQLLCRVRKCAFLATPARIDEAFLQFWGESGSGMADWPFALQVQMFSFLKATENNLQRVRIPSLVVQGERDVHIPPWSGLALSQLLGSCCRGLVVHHDADHFFPGDRGEGADFLVRTVIDFFTTSDGEVCSSGQ